MSRRRTVWCLALVVGTCLPASTLAGEQRASETTPAFLSNDAYVTGLHTQLDLEDVRAVFSHVFAQLDDHVTVYPSEGYYYFRFPMRGVTVKGTLTLPAHQRDDGVMGFGYVGEIEDSPHDRYRQMPGRDHDFDAADGLQLSRQDDFTYEATWAGKTVVFHLYDPGLEAPAPELLASNETYVGTTFDESGLRFALLFNEAIGRLYWMLDERHFVPEAFLLVNDAVVMGARTRFAFYRDPERDRKILIGVQVKEVSYNTWYDGPFDQLPDTYVKMGRIDMRKYLVVHTGLSPDVLDEYGHFVGLPGRRVPVASYRFYEEASELDFVLELDAADEGFYELLTQEAGRELLDGSVGESR